MDSLEREAGLLCMIEPGGLPTRGGMAVATVVSAFSPMYIVRCVARHALSRRVLVPIAEMALDALDVLMLALQRKRGPAVVEFHTLPHRGVMTGCAVSSEFSRVWFLLLVARNTFGMRLPIALAG